MLCGTGRITRCAPTAAELSRLSAMPIEGASQTSPTGAGSATSPVATDRPKLRRIAFAEEPQSLFALFAQADACNDLLQQAIFDVFHGDDEIILKDG